MHALSARVNQPIAVLVQKKRLDRVCGGHTAGNPGWRNSGHAPPSPSAIGARFPTYGSRALGYDYSADRTVRSAQADNDDRQWHEERHKHPSGHPR